MMKGYCGECCWFYAEDTYGYGACPFDFAEVKVCDKGCDTEKYISKKEMRHYIAILRQANRYRRDNNVPSIYKRPNPKELGEAIDFAVDYVKVFSKL